MYLILLVFVLESERFLQLFSNLGLDRLPLDWCNSAAIAYWRLDSPCGSPSNWMFLDQGMSLDQLGRGIQGESLDHHSLPMAHYRQMLLAWASTVASCFSKVSCEIGILFLQHCKVVQEGTFSLTVSESHCISYMLAVFQYTWSFSVYSPPFVFFSAA